LAENCQPAAEKTCTRVEKYCSPFQAVPADIGLLPVILHCTVTIISKHHPASRPGDFLLLSSKALGTEGISA
jgi:hypothetical protein